MARRKGRVKDKWREKRWVSIVAPPAFHNQFLGKIPITSDEHAIGRVIEATLFDILKGRDDVTQHQLKVYFQINKVEDDVAKTIFKRFEYSKEYLRSLVRRGSSKINFVVDIKTKDGYVFRVKVLALTYRQLNTSRKHDLRVIARSTINELVKNMSLDQFSQAGCYHGIESKLISNMRKVIRLRHVGLEKIKLIRTAEKETVLLEA